MSCDIDFDKAVSDISEQAIVIRDAQLVATIEKWLAKLTSEKRGPNEIAYLKLLQYMMARRRIGSPFVRTPPPGPLLPIGKYINPSCCDRSLDKTRTENWDNHYKRVCMAYEEQDSVNSKSDMSTDCVNKSSVENYSVNEKKEIGSHRCMPLHEENRAHRTEQTNRDGHLAGGGEHCESCWGDKSSESKAIDKFAKLCNPCIDDMGRHLINIRPEPIDVAYMELLEECALPVFTEAEQKSVDPKLLNVLKNVNDATTLQDFFFQVSLYTCDQGEVLMKTADGMIDDFRAFVSDVFESRAEHISYDLANEQMLLNDRYTYLKHRVLNRATIAMDFLREAMPVFSWQKYQADPDNYLKRTILRPLAGSASGDANDDVGHPSLIAEDEVTEHSTVKKLLYLLNRLRTEVTRVDCEGQRMNELHNKLTANVAESNNRLFAAQCRSANEIERLKNELTLLRKQLHDQITNSDSLMEKIQLALQNKQSTTDSVNC